MRRLVMVDSFLQDCRFAWRGLRRSPGFTAVAAGTLALGIGANSAIFTVVNAVVMRPLPYAHADRLVRVTSDFTALSAADVGLSQPELIDYRDRSGLFEAVAGVWAINANLTEIDQPERVEVLLTSPTYFDVLGVRPQLGRFFGPEDNGPGITEVLVISDALWRRRFGASPDAIGRKLRVDNDWYTIVGVVPPGFRHPGRSVLTDVDVWAPASFVGKPFPDTPQRSNYFITGAIARLKPGITVEQARERLAAIGNGWRAAYPNDYPARAAWSPRIMPLHEDLVGSVKPALLLVFGAVGLVLLIACANIANLLLARGAGRLRELAVRRALGSSRGRLVRLLLIESVVLAVLGGLAGAVITVWLLEVLLALIPAGVPRLQEIGVDGQVLAFTAVIAIATALLFGTIPAIQFSRADVNDALKDGARGASGARGWLRSSLVIVEFALALVLLVGAALLVRSFWRLHRVELGFDPHDILTARLWLPQPNDPNAGPYSNRTTGHARRLAAYEEILRRARSLPGVTGAAAAGALPFDGNRSSVVFTAEGSEVEDRSRLPTSQLTVASADYFDVMGIRLVRGRTFSEQDDARGAPVAVVTESIARHSWPGRDPLGKRLHLGGPHANAPWMTVVGVVQDVRTRRLEDDPRPTLYRPLKQATGLSLSLVLKTGADPDRLRYALAAEVRAVDPDLPTYGVRTMDEMVALATASRRFSTELLGAFAILALVLAAVGIYGVMAFVVGQRTREIGIRIALGARPGAVVRLVLRQALTLAALGIAGGVAAAVMATRLLAGLLFQVRATDPITYTLIVALLGSTAAVAAWRPARRAARVDPIRALRAD
ncbi:MAG TPA: ABC transporter permease [Vicinamibacterales bacterium]|jgi:predicted permease|nr:ABC transporter permease [Vicinamibacterales bacterium]